jgi:hypothetical protein
LFSVSYKKREKRGNTIIARREEGGENSVLFSVSYKK